MTEQFDEVNEADIPTGRLITKIQAHDQNLIHRCSVIYIFDRRGKLYVQKHKKSGNRFDHSVGGHVISGESYKEAASRELQEELNMNAALKEITKHFLSRERKTTHMYGIFAGIAPTNWAFHPNHEVNEVILMDIKEVYKNISNNPEKFTGGMINTFPIIWKYIQTT